LLLAAAVIGCQGPPEISINEFMADNESSMVEGETGDYVDWIELYNNGSQAVSLDGLFLTDDLSAPLMHPLDASLEIDAGGFLLLWAIEAASDNPSHLSFALAREGEAIGLYIEDADGNFSTLDAVVYDEQQPDQSMARMEDGVGSWAATDQPSPGASNQ